MCVCNWFFFFRKQAMNNSLTLLHEAWFIVISEVLENLELMDRTSVFIWIGGCFGQRAPRLSLRSWVLMLISPKITGYSIWCLVQLVGGSYACWQKRRLRWAPSIPQSLLWDSSSLSVFFHITGHPDCHGCKKSHHSSWGQTHIYCMNMI